MPIQKWITKMQKKKNQIIHFHEKSVLQFCYRAVQLCLDTMVCSPKRDERLKCKSASNEGSKRTRRRLFFCKKRTWTSLTSKEMFFETLKNIIWLHIILAPIVQCYYGNEWKKKVHGSLVNTALHSCAKQCKAWISKILLWPCTVSSSKMSYVISLQFKTCQM